MVKRKASKRRKVVTIPEEAPASVDRNLELLELLKGFDALIDKVVEFLSTDELAKLLGLVANRGKVKTTTFKMARTKLPSFFGAKWIDFVKGSGFCPTLEDNHCWQFDHVVTPVYRLPPSIHEIMFEEAWHIQDVYRERRVQNSQEARSRIMDPYLVRIIGLFQGRVIDKLEQDILESDANGVEHEIVMIDGILFVIAEMKRDISKEDNAARLFVEILAAAKENEGEDFANLRIYGLLTNLVEYDFYSYDPRTKKFAFDNFILVNNTRDLSLTNMIPVGNKIFGVILTAYIDGLAARILSSMERIEKGNVSHYLDQDVTDCNAALQFAQQCVDKFKEPVESVDDIERNSTAALELLAKSVRSIRRTSRLLGAASDPSSMEEVKDLARHKVHKEYLDMIHDIQYSGS